MSADAGSFMTPRQIARRLGVRDAKVFRWIISGELRAANLAAGPTDTPRYKISPESLAAFIDARAVIPAPKPARRRQRRPEVIEFF